MGTVALLGFLRTLAPLAQGLNVVEPSELIGQRGPNLIGLAVNFVEVAEQVPVPRISASANHSLYARYL